MHNHREGTAHGLVRTFSHRHTHYTFRRGRGGGGGYIKGRGVWDNKHLDLGGNVYVFLFPARVECPGSQGAAPVEGGGLGGERRREGVGRLGERVFGTPRRRDCGGTCDGGGLN